MVKILSPEKVRVAQALPQILYIGNFEAELRPAIMQVDGLAVVATTSIDLGLTHARQRQFDFVIFDQRDPHLASKHIGPLIQGLGSTAKMVVVSQLGNLGAYLKVPGIASVLAAPIKPQHLLRVLGLSPTCEPSLNAPISLRRAS